MIRVSVMYPNTPGARFNHEYYRDKHMPLLKKRMGDACHYYSIDKGLAGGAPGAPADLRRDVSLFLRFGRVVSGWLRTACPGDHG